MRTNVSELAISPDSSVREALELIDGNRLGIAVVVDAEGCILGTITDGDIRRAILRGSAMDARCAGLMNDTPRTLLESANEDVLGLMREHGVRQIPVLDDDRRFVGLHFLPDIVASPSMPAVIMAGGLGSRLGELTSATPKPLIEVAGKPILQHIVEHLGDAGIGDVFITTRYLADQIEDYFQDGEEWGVSIEYVREEQRLGTAGGLKAIAHMIDRSFLVMNGDLITNLNVEELTHFHQQSGADMTVCVRHYSMEVPFGVVRLEGSDVREISEKPRYDFFVNAGVYVLEPSVLELVPSTGRFDMTQLIEELLRIDRRVSSFPILERWLDVGRPADLHLANEVLREKR